MHGTMASKWSVLLAIAIVCLYTAVTFRMYGERHLGGEWGAHVLSSSMFGVPEDIAKHGFAPKFGKTVPGWDGQFYFYMANDVFGTKDTPNHIDIPSYRYQRIGLSLVSASVAWGFGFDWVSPTLYLACNLAIAFAGLLAGLFLFIRLNIPPFVIALWALSPGTQTTLLNGLTDAAADSFFLIGMLAFWIHRENGRKIALTLALLGFTLAALTREIYSMFLVVLFLLSLKNVESQKTRLIFVLPILVIAVWQAFVRLKFNGTIHPASLWDGTATAFPLTEWLNHLVVAVSARHPLVNNASHVGEAVCLSLFMFMVLITGLVALDILFKRKFQMNFGVEGSLPIYATIFATVALSFGGIVMNYWHGYVKAISSLFFILPILVAMSDRQTLSFRSIVFSLAPAIQAILVLSWTIFSIYYIAARIV